MLQRLLPLELPYLERIQSTIYLPIGYIISAKGYILPQPSKYNCSQNPRPLPSLPHTPNPNTHHPNQTYVKSLILQIRSFFVITQTTNMKRDSINELLRRKEERRRKPSQKSQIRARRGHLQ